VFPPYPTVLVSYVKMLVRLVATLLSLVPWTPSQALALTRLLTTLRGLGFAAACFASVVVSVPIALA
jgi:hypothetical protein